MWLGDLFWGLCVGMSGWLDFVCHDGMSFVLMDLLSYSVLLCVWYDVGFYFWVG